MYSTFTIIDALILIAYLIAVLSIGFYYSRKRINNSSDFFLAGRNMGWITVGLSIFATNISSEHFIGLAGSGASRGLAVGQFELMAIFILIVLGWVIAPIYLKSGVKTMPEFLEQRFDRSSRSFFMFTSIIIYFFTKVSVTLFAGGILFHNIFGLSIYTSAIILILITGLYSVIGGTAAIMKTHVFQAIMLILGALVLTIFGMHEVGGLSGLRDKVPVDFFDMFKPSTDPDYPWTGIVFGAPIIAFWYWCTDQYIIQRLLCSRSINDARRGTLLAAVLKILPLFILVLPGVIAIALYPEIKGDEAYPVLLSGNLLPTGIKGFVIAGLLAAIMSSLASVFDSTAALFTNDFYKPRNPNASEHKMVLIGRLSTTVIVLLSILCVPLVKLISSQVYLFLQSVQAFVGPPVTVVFLFGLIFKKVTSSAAIWTLVIGESVGLIRMLLGMLVDYNMIVNPLIISIVNINFLHFAIILFLFCSVLMIAISFFTQKIEASTPGKTKYLFGESVRDISYINKSGEIANSRTNIVISIFILLVIISLWSLW